MDLDFESPLLWLIASIVLGILANLLTPDRSLVASFFRQRVDRFRNWRAQRSAKRARERIDELRLEINKISSYADSDTELSLFLHEEIVNILTSLCGATLLFFLSIASSYVLVSSSFGSLLDVLPFAMAMVPTFFLLPVVRRGYGVLETLYKVRDFTEFKASAESLIARLEEVLDEHSALTEVMASETETDESQGVGQRVVESSKFYYIVSRLSDFKCLDVYGSQIADDTNIQLFTKRGGPNQQWKLEETEGGYFVIISKLSDVKCLDVRGAQPVDNANIQLYTLDRGKPNQQWRLEKIEDGYFVIVSKLSDTKCLDVKREETVDETNIQLFTKHGGPNQQWKLIPAGE